MFSQWKSAKATFEKPQKKTGPTGLKKEDGSTRRRMEKLSN
jgi:hypothetical protein